MLEKELFLGAIAPDISKLIGEKREKSHFLNQQELPDLNAFLKKYQQNFSHPFIMGYYIHLFTDYLWYKYFFNEISNLEDSIKLLNGDKVKCSKDELRKLIYNDYTNLNILIIDEYNLDLSLFYEELEIPKLDFKEIPLDKLQILVDQMGIIIENSKQDFCYTFNLDNINTFINLCKDIIYTDIKMRLN